MNYSIDIERFYSPVEIEGFPLIHMTKSWEILELILQEGLQPSYCNECITNLIESKSACFPMISTSNVSIDFAISNQRSYGTFGIVLDKVWGEMNDFNPVIYLERRSDITNEIISNFKYITSKSTEDIKNALNDITTDHKSLLTKLLVKIFAHSKNYDGELVRNGVLESEKYLFGIEREWRKIIKKEDVQYFLVGKEIEEKKIFNQKIKNIKVDFELGHLKGVIVECDYQAEMVKQIICKKFGISKFPDQIILKKNLMRHVPDEG